MHHTLMNLVITTLFKKYVDPQLKMSIFGSVLNSCVYNVNSTYPYIPGKALFAMVNQNVFFFSVLRLWNDRKCTMQIPRSELIRNNHDCIDISAGKELIRSLCCRQEGEISQSPPYINILSKIWKMIFSLFSNVSMILLEHISKPQITKIFPHWPMEHI